MQEKLRLMPAQSRQIVAAVVTHRTFGGSIIETGTDSDRLAHTKHRLATSA